MFGIKTIIKGGPRGAPLVRHLPLLPVVTLLLTGCASTDGGGHGATRTSEPVPRAAVIPAGARGATGGTPPAAMDERVALTGGESITGAQSALSTCLFEAKQLAQLSRGEYRSQVEALYAQLRAAKAYAALEGSLPGSTTNTITPLYQYRVNDACNGISQALLAELKKGMVPSSPAMARGHNP